MNKSGPSIETVVCHLKPLPSMKIYHQPLFSVCGLIRSF